jgi:hypothetical protein
MELAHLPVPEQGESPEPRRLVAADKPLQYVESASPAPVLAGENDIALRLRKWEELHDADLITQYEYEVKRQEILDSL